MNKKDIKKYYVGSKDIAAFIHGGSNSHHACSTVDEAVERGIKAMHSEDRDCVIVVKIIRVIRKREMPVIVEKV